MPDAAQKMKFSIKDFFSKCDQIRRITFTEEILNGKLHFLCSVRKHVFHFNIKGAGEIALNCMNLLRGFTYSNFEIILYHKTLNILVA